MGWFIKFIESSLGKKYVMAITGFFLILFLIIHLLGNLALYAGDGGVLFNTYSSTLRGIWLIPVIEAILFLGFLVHAIDGTRLWILNKKAKGGKYAVKTKSEATDIYSKFMMQTGAIVFVFLVIHLNTFFVPAAITGHPDTTLFQIVVGAFSSPIYSGFYVLAMILLGLHLNHGFQSAFQTFGWNHKKYFPLVKAVGSIYAILMSAAFASMPIYFYFFYNGGGN